MLHLLKSTLLLSSLLSFSFPGHSIPQSPSAAPQQSPVPKSNQLTYSCKAVNMSAYSCDLNQPESCCTHKLGLLVLAQQWSNGFGPAEHFTLHGLWPDFCDGTWGPTGGCDASRLYTDVSKFLPTQLIEQMNIVWPSYTRNNTKFWSYEWGKHGTCVSTLEPRCFPSANYFKGMEVVPYFQSVVKLNRRYDIYSALKKAGIVPKGLRNFPLNPKDLIPLTLVDRAIRDSFGVRAQINCTAGVLNEIMIYFKSQGRDGYVPVSTNDPHGCPEMILYPLKYASGETGPKLWSLTDDPVKPKAPSATKPTTPKVSNPKTPTEIKKNAPNPGSPPAKPPPRPKAAAIPHDDDKAKKATPRSASKKPPPAAKKATPPLQKPEAKKVSVEEPEMEPTMEISVNGVSV